MIDRNEKMPKDIGKTEATEMIAIDFQIMILARQSEEGA